MSISTVQRTLAAKCAASSTEQSLVSPSSLFSCQRGALGALFFSHRARVLGLTLGLCLALAAPVPAHILWIVPSTFHPEAHGLVKIALRLGMPSKPDALPRVRSSIERFLVFCGEEGEGEAEGFEPQGLEGLDPAGIFRPAETGPCTIVYASHPTPLDPPLEAGKFESYLEDEGLEPVLAYRAQHGESGLPGREAFSRSIKSLLAAPGYALRDRVRGLPLELVLENEDVAKGRIELQLLFRGKPLAQALVKVHRFGQDDVVTEARTGENGDVELQIGPGQWLISAVHAERSDAPEIDWRSWWASLTFELGGGESAAP